GKPPSLAALAAFFSEPGVEVAILDAAGAVLAESKRGTAAGIGPAAPRLDFVEAGRQLRLLMLEHAAGVPDQAADAVPPAPLLNDAGLVIRHVAPQEGNAPPPARREIPTIELRPAQPAAKQPRSPAAAEP